MKKIFLLVALAFAAAGAAQTFTLKSKDLGGQFDNKHFGNSFGCNGENISPELNWENAPKDAKSFAVTMFDTDAPTESGFWHWVVYNLPAGTTSLAADAGNHSGKNLPKDAVNGANDVGASGYVGPCPPAGSSHRYIITVYALKAPLQLDKNASAALINYMLNGNAISKASIISYGQR